MAHHIARLEAQVVALSAHARLPCAAPADVVPAEVVSLARAGRTRDAIKAYRAATGAGLDEARTVVPGL